MEISETVLKKLKRALTGGEGLEVINHRKRERRKEQSNHLRGVSGGEVSGMQQERKSCLGNELCNFRSGLENKNQAAGGEGPGEM